MKSLLVNDLTKIRLVSVNSESEKRCISHF